MSVWTHVNAQIRLDSIEIITGSIQEDLEDIIGPMYLPYADEIALEWPITDNENKVKLPTGSEGSLHIKVNKNPEESSTASHVISIYGDLRDFDNYKEIEKWFKNLCEDLEDKEKCRAVGIRQAVCQIEVEFSNPRQIVLIYNKDIADIIKFNVNA